jgi:hypothetical protein
MSKQFNPNFTDIIIFPSKFEGALAYGKFQVAGLMWVNFTLRESKNDQEPWVALPYKSKGQDKKGFNQVEMIVDEVQGLDAKADLAAFILNAYEERIASLPSKTPIELNTLSDSEPKEDIPF